jgi:type III secretory pathway component EscS
MPSLSFFFFESGALVLTSCFVIVCNFLQAVTELQSSMCFGVAGLLPSFSLFMIAWMMQKDPYS